MRCLLAKRLISRGTGLPSAVGGRFGAARFGAQLARHRVFEEQGGIFAGLDEAVGDLGDFEAGVHRLGDADQFALFLEETDKGSADPWWEYRRSWPFGFLGGNYRIHGGDG